MEIYGVNLRFQSEYRKIRTRKNSFFGNFSRSVFLICYNFKLTHLPILAQCSISTPPEKRQKNFRFLTFSRGIEMEHCAKVG